MPVKTRNKATTDARTITAMAVRQELLAILADQARELAALQAAVRQLAPPGMLVPVYTANPATEATDATDPNWRGLPVDTAGPASGVATGPIVPTNPDWRVLPDGTRQFIGVPEPGINTVPNIMPDAGPEWGPGATVRRRGVFSDPPHVVVAVQGWAVRATFTRTDGSVDTLELSTDQLELLTKAP